MGLFQVREFERATERVDRKVPRASITKALRGEATAVIYDRLEAALDLLEESMAHDEPESAGEQVEIEVRDIVGIGQVIFRGPVGDMPQFEAMLERLIERQRRQGG